MKALENPEGLCVAIARERTVSKQWEEIGVQLLGVVVLEKTVGGLTRMTG